MEIPRARLRCHFVTVPYASAQTAHKALDEAAHAVGRLLSSRWDAAAMCYEADYAQSEPGPGRVERFVGHVEEDQFVLEGKVEWLPAAATV